MKGTDLQVRETVLPSLVAHAIGYETVVGAYNTVGALMHVVGSIVFFWYGKYRHLSYCWTNVSAHNTVRVLTCLEGCGAPF